MNSGNMCSAMVASSWNTNVGPQKLCDRKCMFDVYDVECSVQCALVATVGKRVGQSYTRVGDVAQHDAGFGNGKVNDTGDGHGTANQDDIAYGNHIGEGDNAGDVEQYHTEYGNNAGGVDNAGDVERRYTEYGNNPGYVANT
eukprot:15477852-Alexandrium_andersonii.AAC.1